LKKSIDFNDKSTGEVPPKASNMHPLQLHVPTNELEGPKINTINVEPESKGNSQDVSKMEVIDLTSISIVQSLNSLISQTDQDNFDTNHVIT
jgi:hypothetical protein